MTSRRISLAIACVLFFSFVSQLSAQTMPPHVKRGGIGKLVGEWSCETDVDGKISRWESSVKWSPDREMLDVQLVGNGHHHGPREHRKRDIGLGCSAKQLAIELEIDADGSTYKSTHPTFRRMASGLIPTEGTSMVDGKPVHVESLRCHVEVQRRVGGDRYASRHCRQTSSQ